MVAESISKQTILDNADAPKLRTNTIKGMVQPKQIKKQNEYVS
jgi:hypothetical protein